MRFKDFMENVVDATDKFQQRRNAATKGMLRQQAMHINKDLADNEHWHGQTHAHVKRAELRDRVDDLIVKFDNQFPKTELKDALVDPKATIFHLLAYSKFDPHPATVEFVKKHKADLKAAINELDDRLQKYEWSLKNQPKSYGLEYLMKVKKEVVRVRQILNGMK